MNRRRAERCDDDRREQKADPERTGPVDDLEAHVGAQHVERPVGEIDHPKHAENKRQSCRQQEQEEAQTEADDDRGHGCVTSLSEGKGRGGGP